VPATTDNRLMITVASVTLTITSLSPRFPIVVSLYLPLSPLC
jgi:hypothetical protein